MTHHRILIIALFSLFGASYPCTIRDSRILLFHSICHSGWRLERTLAFLKNIRIYSNANPTFQFTKSGVKSLEIRNKSTYSLKSYKKEKYFISNNQELQCQNSLFPSKRKARNRFYSKWKNILQWKSPQRGNHKGDSLPNKHFQQQ